MSKNSRKLPDETIEELFESTANVRGPIKRSKQVYSTTESVKLIRKLHNNKRYLRERESTSIEVSGNCG